MKGRVKITKKVVLLIIVTLVFSVSLFLAFSQQPLNQNPLTIPTQPISQTSANSKMGTHLQYLMQTSNPSAEYEMIIFFEKTVNYTQGISMLVKLGSFEIISNYTQLNGICIKAPIRMAESISQQNYVRSVTYNEKIQLPPDQITTEEIHALDVNANDVIGASTLQDPPYNLKGTGVYVAVIDTGINPHVDLPGSRIIYSQSFVPGENPTDYAGHGTAVAGIIGASGSIATGVAPAVEFLNLKVLNYYGGGTMDWVVAGINEAVRNTPDHPKADIISMSLGFRSGTSYDDASKAVNNAWIDGDTIVVVAAGNEGGYYDFNENYHGPYYGNIRSPGLAANIITVGATGGLDLYSINYSSIAYFSSRGPTGDGRAKPDIVAPGRDLTTLRNDGSGYWYSSFSGTSASAPVVSGAIALLLDDNSNVSWISPNTVKAAIMMMAEDLGDNPFAQGAGQINISRAYNYLQDYYINENPTTPPPLVITPIRAIAHPMHLRDLIPTGVVLTIVVGNVTRTPIINASFSVSGNARAFTTVHSGVFPNLNDTQEFELVTFVVPLGRSAQVFSGNLTLVNGSSYVLFTIPLSLYDASHTDWPVSILLWFLIMNKLNSENNGSNLVSVWTGLVALGSVATIGLVFALVDIKKPRVPRKLKVPELIQLSTIIVNYCPYCGTKVGAKDFFCYNCGKQIRTPPPQPHKHTLKRLKRLKKVKK